MTDAALLERPEARSIPLPPPASRHVPQLPPQPAPGMPMPTTMVVFLFRKPNEPEVHHGRIFLQGIPNLRTRLAVEQTEKAIAEHAEGAIRDVVITDWKGLDG